MSESHDNSRNQMSLAKQNYHVLTQVTHDANVTGRKFISHCQLLTFIRDNAFAYKAVLESCRTLIALTSGNALIVADGNTIDFL